MENNSLKLGTDGLPFSQYYDDDTNNNEGLRGKQGGMYAYINGTNIVLPVEIKTAEKEMMFRSFALLGANGFYISNSFDSIGANRLTGQVSASHSGTLYIQQSDDGIEWYNANTTSISASTNTTINSVVYKSASTFEFKITTRYVRAIFVNGATAQTSFAISGYISAL